MKIKAALGTLLLVLLCCTFACAQEQADEAANDEGVTTEQSTYVARAGQYIPVETLDITYQQENAPAIYAQMQDGQAYLFLPSGVTVDALTIGGKTVACTLTEGENSITDAGGNEISLMVMQSANLPAVYLQSDDPVSAGREQVDSAEDHAITVQASLTMVNTAGDTEYQGHISKLRGRGNTTWEWGDKRPYQLKLDTKADLLGTGNANKTFLLLAECFDATLLHNTLCLDVAAQLGLPTPAHEAVDLYYDGVYRGTYLLCEKVEVREGLLAILDYNKLIDKEYNTDSVELPVAETENAYGCTYTYRDGLDVEGGENIAFLVEIDQYFYNEEPVWVSTQSGFHFTVQNPSNLSKADGVYISEFLQRIENAVVNGGTEPDTGEQLHDMLDFDSLARFFLVSEWSKNPDYWRGSTYFYKPADEHKLYAGPVWDFDIAFGIRKGESGVTGYLRGDDSWLYYLTRNPEFQLAVRKVWETELKPIVSSLDVDAYVNHIAKSAAMNFVLWPYGGEYNNINWDTLYDTWDENLNFLRTYLDGRLQWLTEDIAGWMGYEITSTALSLHYRNADVINSAALEVANIRNNLTVSGIRWETASDEAVKWNNLYTVTATLTANDGCMLADGFSVTVNGAPVTLLTSDGHTATVRFTFSGTKYEPADYYGDDYGMLYQYDYFVAHNPAVVEECGTDDPEEMLDYFVSSGLYDELCGIETYVPQAFINNYYSMLNAYYMADPEMCAEHYREYYQEEDLLGMEQEIVPEVIEP